ncbi:MAG TPA: DMT family transporter [Gammaproteobacteria bacterium]|nr:DMT family transporter [Gammaproteobacteria bacterium]HIO03057.1 DMT family transporter [Alphaproteobacteria bacterium]
MRLSETGSTNLARLACALAGGVWGIIWIPLRALHNAGIPGAWATSLFHLIPALVLLPLVVLRFTKIKAAGAPLQAIGSSLGLSMMLYSTAFLYTDVIHAVLLYYLTPIWSTLLAKAWLKEPISRNRIIGIVLGLSGMLIILNIEQDFPLPRNVGDWMALAAGMTWAVAANLLRRYPRYRTLDITTTWFYWCTVFSVIVAYATYPHIGPETVDAVFKVSIWILPIALLVLIPVYFAAAWGTPKLNPGTAGILFMTEISAGVVSAALLTNEPFGMREILGVGLITAAGLTEFVAPILAATFPASRRRRSREN